MVQLPGRCHLTGQKTVPDKTVEPQLWPAQISTQAVGSTVDVGGSNGLVSLLRALAGTVDIWLGRQILRAEILFDIFGSLLLCLGSDIERVGTHIGDQAHRAFPATFDALVELLGQAHGLRGAELQMAAGSLLQSTGDEGRGRILTARAGTHLGHLMPYTLAQQCLLETQGPLLVRNQGLLGIDARKLGLELGFRLGTQKHGLEIPVFLGLESQYFAFALDNQAQGH